MWCSGGHEHLDVGGALIQIPIAYLGYNFIGYCLLFLSLYFKDLKYTIKASKKTEGAKNRKMTDKKVKA
jgi:hypothetical protein